MKLLRRIAKGTSAALSVAFAVIQFVPVDRSNHPVEEEVPASPEARAVLRRACYDCHSNETVWPWYSRIAPISWLVANDVHEARAEMNFSLWNLRTRKERIKAFEESWEQVEKGKMPLGIYLPLHPKARLSETDRSVLQAWSRSAASEESNKR